MRLFEKLISIFVWGFMKASHFFFFGHYEGLSLNEAKISTCILLLRAELFKRKEKYDVIVGDLADPLEDGPCYQLYTKSFYEKMLKPKLNDNGIFVTQVNYYEHPFMS